MTHPLVVLKALACFRVLGRLSLFADSDHAWIQRAGQGVEGCMCSVMDQASHWMGIGAVELHGWVVYAPVLNNLAATDR